MGGQFITFCRSRNALLDPHIQRDLIDHCRRKEGVHERTVRNNDDRSAACVGIML